MCEAETSAPLEETAARSPKRLQRSVWSGALLRPLGYDFWGIERVTSGFDLLGGTRLHVDFSELSGPVEIKKAFGFSTISVPIKRHGRLDVAGIGKNDATRSAARTA